MGSRVELLGLGTDDGDTAVYLESTASLVADGAQPAATELLNSRLPTQQHLDLADVGPAGLAG